MIRRCFNLFRGIGPARETAVRAAGISDWEQFLAADAVPGLPEALRRSVAGQIREWSAALARQDAAFLAKAVPQAEHWALYEEFRGSVRYLDIETTGLSPDWDEVTVVGVYDGRQYRSLTKGLGLTADALREALEGCRLLVSYFGSAFDVPFLRASFPGLAWGFPHFDLCFAGRRAGLAGGLKAGERKLGIARDERIAETDGFEAVRLWRAHESGDAAALAKLIDYNRADTVNLARIAPVVYRRLSGAHGQADGARTMPCSPTPSRAVERQGPC